MPKHNFFGTEIDSTDSETYQTLIADPLLDAARVMHLKTCENHEYEIDRDATISLLAEEVRAISFIMPYWAEFLSGGVVSALVPESAASAFRKVDVAALSNESLEITVPEAEMIYASIVSVNSAIAMRNALLYMFYGAGDDEDS